MGRASRAKQAKIYTEKCFNIFRNEKGWKIFISAAIITIIISTVTSSEMFNDYKDTRNGAFALVCACIWIGIFNSIQSICKERDIIKREHRSGLHILSYITAHMIFEFVLCFIESIIITLIVCVKNFDNLPDGGVFLPSGIELFISFLLIVYSSDALGMMVSSIVKTTNTAMTVMPFVLIIQLVMSGMIFELSGFTEIISKLTVAKWGLNAICTTADINSMFSVLATGDPADYEHSIEHLGQMWLILIAFTLIYGIISIISLEFVDKDKR